MSITNHATSVTTRSGLQAVGEIVDEQALQPRRTFLKGRAPKSKSVHDLRRQIQCRARTASEWRMSIALSDLDDGVPVSLVRAPYEAEIALIGEYAAARDEQRGIATPDAPILPLIQRANRFQADQDAAERELLANPESIEAHDRVLNANARCQAENERIMGALRARRARLHMRRMRRSETTKPAGRDVPDGPMSITTPATYAIGVHRGSGMEGR